MVAHTQTSNRLPLAVTADPELLDELLRLAAEAGSELEVAADTVAARPRVAGAPLVLVDLALAGPYARLDLPRRPGVIVVCGGSGVPDEAWRAAEAVGAEYVTTLPAAAPWLTERLATGCGDRRGDASVVAVIGGRGGAGASVLAAGLAVTGARTGLRTLLVDADTLGGGVDLVLGWESVGGQRWPELAGPDRATGDVVELPRQGDLAVISWDRGDLVTLAPDAMAAALDAGRAARDLVVLDLPRRLDEAARIGVRAADRVLLVVPAELRACAAAARVAADVAPLCAGLEVVVRGPAPAGLRPRDLARALGLPLAATMRSESGLTRGLERGEAPAGTGRGPLAEACLRLLRDVRSGRPVPA